MNKTGKVTIAAIFDYIAPSIIVGALFMIILALNGEWPFGRDTIDYYDMAQWSDLFYYHNYDELRGLKSFVYDWYLNLGREIPGLSEPSVFDLLLYLVPRYLFLECSSLLMAVRIMAAAFSMNLFVRYINKGMPFFYRMMISAGYGLCGFVLVNYTIQQWLDMAALVPFVLMFAQKCLKTGKFAGLSITIFLIMILDYYFAIQMLMFVFLIGGAYYICLGRPSKRRPEREQLFITRLLVGILTGMGLASFSWIPDMTSNFTSARFGNGVSDGGLTGNYISVLGNIQPAYLSRWFVLLGLSFPTAVVVIGLWKNLKNRRYPSLVFCLLCIFMATSQLVVESIHLMLHFMSYVDYPVRNGFIIYCIMAGFAAASYDINEDSDESDPGNPAIGIVIAMIPAVFAAAGFRYRYVEHRITDHTVLLFTMGFMTVCVLVHIVLINRKSRRKIYMSVFLWACELLIFGVIMIGKPLYDTPYGSDPEQEGEFIRISDQLVQSFGDKLKTGQDAAMCRIKNPDTSLNANYGLVMRRETLAGWTNLAGADQIRGAVSLGYSNQFTRILDSGGNIFTDTLIHVTDLISHRKLDEKLYEKTAQADAVIDHMTGEKVMYYLYKNRYELPFAIPVYDVPLSDVDDEDPVAYFNSFANVMGRKEPVADPVGSPDKTTSRDGRQISEYNIKTEGKKALYFKGRCVDTDYYNTRIYVNGNLIGIPSIRENENDLFPAHFNNNTVELGSFDNEDVSVTVDMDISDPVQKYDYCLYEIDLDALEDICNDVYGTVTVSQGKRSLDIMLDGVPEEYKGVLIPVSYSKGWTAIADGVRVDITNVGGLFMYVPINGEKEIKMTYFPPMMKYGIIIAVISVVSLVGFSLTDKKKRPSSGKADRVLGELYSVAFMAVFAIVYLIPAVAAVLYRLL